MWNKIKYFITNPFYWNVATAILSIICTGLWMAGGHTLLAIVWAVCAGCDIAMAWFNRGEK